MTAQPVPQLQPRLMKLRLGIADRIVHDLGDFVVFVSFHVVQHKDRPVAGWKLRDGPVQADAVNQAQKPSVVVPVLALHRLFLRRVRVVERHLLNAFLPQVHQYDVDHQAVQPSRKRGLSAEGPDLTKKLQERFLGQVFRLRGVSDHAQAQRIHAPLVRFEECCKRCFIPTLGARDKLSLRSGLRRRIFLWAQSVSLGPHLNSLGEMRSLRRELYLVLKIDD